MLPATADAIVCPTCGKRYLCKPELAGKQVRCKCGTVIAVPASVPGAPNTVAGQDAISIQDQPPPMAPLSRPAADCDDLYDLAEDKTPPPPRAVAASPQQPQEFIPIIVPGLEDDTSCPSCDKPMPPGAIICGHCGFNLKTGTKPNRTAKAASPKSAVAAFAGMARPHKVEVKEDKAGELIKILIPIAGLVIVLAIALGGFFLIRKMSPPAQLKGADEQVLRLIDDSGAKEIHAWFKQDPDRIAGEYSTTQALAKADELEAMGAKQVLAFGARMTRALAVELPDNPEERKTLFAWENKFALEHRYKPDTDVGQKYLLLQLN